MYAVYIHKRKDTGKVFYIGKAKKICRIYPRSTNQSNRNKYWHNVVNKVGFTSEIIFSDLTNEEACKWEILLIKLYRINSSLTNISDGGEGAYGIKQTPERIANRVSKLKALYASGSLDYLKEKTRTTTAKAKWKQVHCIELNMTFESLQAAAKYVGAKDYKSISNCLRRKALTANGYTWQYVANMVI